MKHRVRRRMTQSGKKKLISVIVVLLIVSAIVAGAYYILEKKKTVEGLYLGRINELEHHISASTRRVYSASHDLKAGSVITYDDVVEKEVLSDDCSYISDADFGKTLLVDVSEGELLFKVLFSDSVTDTGLREVEYDFIDVSSNISIGDYVDIRIMYPDGTDYIVASKKQIIGLNDTKLVADIYCLEEEILLLDSAVVDAYLYEGTKIYVTKYILPGLQEPSVVNYSPSAVISELIGINPNIVVIASAYLSEELRMKKENDLRLFLADDDAAARYDEEGNYLGTPTDAELMAEDLFGEDRMSGTELPKEFGSELWDD